MPNERHLDEGLLPRVVARTREKAEKVADQLGRPARFMEVCGTHTVALSRTGLRSALAGSLAFVSGPGCPVCVTPAKELRQLRAYALQPDTVLATFGDMLRVPDDYGRSLAEARSEGARVEVVMSGLRAVELAADHPEWNVVFGAVGFETTTPATAVAISEARERGLDNFFCHVSHKLTPPAVFALLRGAGPVSLDGFLCPGHVSTVIGSQAWSPLVDEYGFPAVVGGFEAHELLMAVNELLDLVAAATPELRNAYPKVVRREGNVRARELIAAYFEPTIAAWRGLGEVPSSGLRLRPTFREYDAAAHYGDLASGEEEPAGPLAKLTAACRCPGVLTGQLIPPECPLFGKACTPSSPVGPCMVSSEGSCAAYYLYEA